MIKYRNSIICVILTFLYLIVDHFIDSTLTQWGYTIYFAVNSYSDKLLYLSYIAKYSLLMCEILYILLYLRLNRKLDILLIISFSAFILGVHAVLKEFYNQGRPYMMNENIKTLECISELGKPSGHTMAIITYMIGLYQIEKYNYGQVKWMTMKIICYSFFAFAVAVSRIVLGVHSLGQIVSGTVFAICFNVIYYDFIHFRFRNLIIRYLVYASNSKFTLYSITVASFIWFLLVCLCFDQYSKRYFHKNSDLYYEYLNAVKECYKQNDLGEFQETEYFLQKATILSYSGFFFIIGILLGLIMHRGYFQEGLFEAQQSQRNLFHSLLRIIVFLAIFYFWVFYYQQILFYFQDQSLQQVVIFGIIQGLYFTLIYPVFMHIIGFEIPGDLQCWNKQNLFVDYSRIGESDSFSSQ